LDGCGPGEDRAAVWQGAVGDAVSRGR
jgi:hypothetical protein